MAGSDRNHLVEMPIDIIFEILEQITEPADYFHLAMACKDIMNGLDLEREILRVEGRKIRKGVYPRWTMWDIFRHNIPNTIMNWAIRSKMPQDKFLALAQRYAEVFPDVIWGNHELGLASAAEYCVILCNDEALNTLEAAGLK
ncbi:hypothetical protein F5Y02DRAFT_419970 [Annulohypoxylon stygium]|nr:hypothetical protein F5Y02DRAFT_419970 [Annulohypoxylon stygium]